MFGLDTFPLGKIGGGAQLVEFMQTFWTKFAKTGDPNVPGLIWSRYDATDTLLVLDLPIMTRVAHKAAQCDFWDAL